MRIGIFGMALCLFTAPAWAAEPGSFEELKEVYFDREDILNGTYVALGATNIGVGAWLLSEDDPFSNGMGSPLVAVGGIQLITGAVYLAVTPSFKREATLEGERERMVPVVDFFPVYQTIEVLTMASGVVILSQGVSNDDAHLQGVGTALAVSGAIQLCFETAVRWVAESYARDLEGIQVGIAPTSNGSLAVASASF